MKFINRLERKFGKYAIYDVMKYFMIIWVGSTLIANFIPHGLDIYEQYLALDFAKVFRGQIWRIITFIFTPYDLRSFTGILFFFIQVSLYLYIGRSLENVWGTFRFNLFLAGGVLFNLLGGLIYYIGMVVIYSVNGVDIGLIDGTYIVGLDYLFQSMFFAFAMLFPNVQVLLYFVIPVKVKYLAVIDAVMLAMVVVGSLTRGEFYTAIGILVALANFFIFFFAFKGKAMSPKHRVRRAAFQREVQHAGNGPRHRCAVCGRTELDGEHLEFRYCSKCKGNMEYCSDHLFTHEHVK